MGGGVALVLAILALSCEKFFDFKNPGGLPIICLPLELVWTPTLFLSISSTLETYFVLPTLAWFIIGSLIGLLVEHIKLKKRAHH